MIQVSVDQFHPIGDDFWATDASTHRYTLRNRYTFIDGGVWANNPVMVGLVDALTCFDIDRRQVRILSLGTGQTRFRTGRRLTFGGRLFWAKGFYEAAMRAQSHNALGQAYLLVGRDQVLRLDAPEASTWIEMDDVAQAITELPGVARSLVDGAGQQVVREFLTHSSVRTNTTTSFEQQ